MTLRGTSYEDCVSDAAVRLFNNTESSRTIKKVAVIKNSEMREMFSTVRPHIMLVICIMVLALGKNMSITHKMKYYI
jgi:hypothetical protein